MSRTPDEYEAEIQKLKLELEHARALIAPSANTLAAAPAVPNPAGGTTGTLAGLEEMVLLVAPDDTIGYLNGPMGKLLGIDEPKRFVGQPLSEIDGGPLGDKVFAALVQVARRAEQPYVLEALYPLIPTERLPATGGRPATAPILRFVAAHGRGRVQISVQDVTKLRWLERTFSRYVSPAVIEQMSGMGDDLMQGERRECTILFCDLRGFTDMSQSMPPEGVQEVVNSFLSNMVAVIDALDGTVDKFVGDEIMAIFGAPVRQPDHALRALVCAVEMQRRHGEWMQARTAAGLQARPMGVGLTTGEVFIGNIGTPSRMDYTALGHTVNLAARLCSTAEGGETLTIPKTHAAAIGAIGGYSAAIPVPRLSFKPRGKMPFKNVTEPVDVIAVTVKS